MYPLCNKKRIVDVMSQRIRSMVQYPPKEMSRVILFMLNRVESSVSYGV